MRKKKPFLIVFVAIVLACSIPISASAFGSLSYSDIPYFKDTNGNDVLSINNYPKYHINFNTANSGSYEFVGAVHCVASGSWYSTVVWVPFQGFYLTVLQYSGVPKDFYQTDLATGITRYGCWTIQKRIYNGSPYFSYDTYTFLGDADQSTGLTGLHYFLGFNVFMYQISPINEDNVKGLVYESDKNEIPIAPEDLEDEIDKYCDDNGLTHGDTVVIPSGSATTEQLTENPTTPDGSEVYTNEHGNPAPTYPDGTPAPTYPNGNPAPTYPDGTPAPTYPNGNAVPSTVYNGDFGNELNTEFSKLYSLVDDLDQASSIMESNAEIMSSHCDSTRTLLNDVIGWLPSSVVACLVCGCIMIIAVKITGSGKS